MTWKGGMTDLDPLEVVRKILDIIEDKKGSDIVVLDISAISLLADYFVICTGETSRQLQAMVDDLIPAMKEHGRHSLGVEGGVGSGWILIDYGDVVVHLFSPQQRSYYALDKLWKEAKLVVRIQ
jgi:ribosome-associated protein